MYSIEIDFANGKTVRREYSLLNDVYAVFGKYSQKRKTQITRSTDATEIRFIANETQTGVWTPKGGLRICM